jgi:prolyl-tRNA editing enzyme YbaK/EbsC (Cys-tRNA(Pro) deacylase)
MKRGSIFEVTYPPVPKTKIIKEEGNNKNKSLKLSGAVDIHAKATQRSKALRVNTLFEEVSNLLLRVAALEAQRSQVTPSSQKAGNNSATASPDYPITPRDDEPVRRVKTDVASRHVVGAKFHWVPSDYYDRPLNWRRDILKAPSVTHLCKSMLVENTSYSDKVPNDPTTHNNERYYIAVFQYVERFDSDKLMKYFREVNAGVGKKNFNYRVSDQGEKITGFSNGAFTVYGLSQPVTVVLSKKAAELSPPTLYLGGGHIDLKLEISVQEFIRTAQPIIADITNPLSAEELEGKI